MNEISKLEADLATYANEVRKNIEELVAIQKKRIRILNGALSSEDRIIEKYNNALVAYAKQHELDFSALLITDVVSNGSLLLLSKETQAWEEVNYPRIDPGLYALKNVVSRKKQLLPLVTQLIQSAVL